MQLSIINQLNFDVYTMQTNPPVILVSTWLTLIKSGESDAVRNRASAQLMKAFGCMENVKKFIKENGIQWK